MERMVALRKFRFAGATLEPDEQFFARPNMAKVLRTLQRAEDAPAERPAPVCSVAASELHADDRAELRDRYADLYGKRAFHAWDADTLRQKINQYNRRDMRAED